MDYLSKADVLYLALKNSLLFESTVPGKLQTYLLAGKPIISAVDGETYEFINNNVGIACNSGNISEITKAILTIKNMSVEKRKEMGKIGYELYWSKYSRNHNLDKLIEKMQSAVIENEK